VRILHISEYCHAGSVGGTERYLLDLIRGLQSRGVDNRIGWLSTDTRKSFEADGVVIHPLPSPLMRVDVPPADLVPAAHSLLEEFRPDVLHFHTFGLAEAAIARLAARRGIPYFFTYHSPGWTCRREDLLIWSGQQPCDGEVRTLRCAACKVQERIGGPALGGYLVAFLSSPLDWMFNRSNWMNFRRRVCFLSDTRRYRHSLREFLNGCSLAVSCSEWGRPVLIANGARPERVKIVPQGVPDDFVAASKTSAGPHPPRRLGTPFTIGYIGRVTPVKGVDILAAGFSRVRGDDLRLRIFGVAANEKTVAALNNRLAALAQKDSRIELHPKLSLAEMITAYGALDLVVIPSVTLETGPLVMFEALQMGVPVFGSNRLGHLSVLKNSGTVVEPNTPGGWQTALTMAADEFRIGRWDTRREEIRRRVKLQTMNDVSEVMKEQYKMLETGKAADREGSISMAGL
jgi:glycosyltransferase involved in cell wall biosynthesis